MLPNRKDSVCLQRTTNSSLLPKLSAVPCLHDSASMEDMLWMWTSPGLIQTPDESLYICLQKNQVLNESTLGYENIHIELCRAGSVDKYIV